MISPDQLRRLTDLVGDLQQEVPADGFEVMGELVDSVAESVPGAQYAGLTITGRRQLETPVATGRYPLVMDEIQQSQGEGPWLSSSREEHAIRIDDLAADTRWPRYRSEVLRRTPIRSGLLFRLFAFKRNWGALSLYADRAHAFDHDSVETGRTLATHVALAWGIVERQKQFRKALASRDVIGQAKGVLMERFRIEAAAAFGLLKLLSQEWNTPVIEIAERVVRGPQRPKR